MSVEPQAPRGAHDLPAHQRVAAEIRAWKGRSGLSQERMAELLGIAQQGVSRRLNGYTPFTIDEIAILAEAFGIRPAVLLGEPPTPLEQAAATWGRDRGGMTAAADSEAATQYGGTGTPPPVLRLVPPLEATEAGEWSAEQAS